MIEAALSIAISALVVAMIALAGLVWCIGKLNSTKEFVMVPANRGLGQSEEDVIARALSDIAPTQPPVSEAEQERLLKEAENAWSVLDDDIDIVRS